METIVWRWSDNEGRIHKFRIPNSYYVPQGKVRLLSPQHWAKIQKDHKPILKGTGSKTNSKNITLYWNQQNNKLTVPLSVATNVAMFQSAPGYQHFEAFCAEAGLDTYSEDAVTIEACQPK
jgi:hypothetical protein